jgi:outer membrane lipoprotein-sorting protein
LVLAVLALALASPVHAQKDAPKADAPKADAKADAPKVDELIAKNLKAKGGMDKIKAMKSLRATGHMSLGPEMEAPFVMVLKRPNEMRMEFTLQGMTGVQAYDGKNAWAVMPFMGKKDPEPMSADDAKMVEEQSDFDGPLVDYKAKGNTIELAGRETVEGVNAYKLKVTRKSGEIRYIYLDPDAYLEIASDATRNVRGTEMEIYSTIGDYKDVNGVMLAHSIESGQKGSTMKQKMTVDKYEVNVDVAETSFTMPAKADSSAAAAASAAGATSASTPPAPQGKGDVKPATEKKK